jgi:hypothetical protein
MARFIKYYDMYDHWLFGNSDYFKWWLDLIYLANWEDKKVLLGNSVVIVERGSLAWSQVKLSERWKCSVQNVRTFLNLLGKDGMIKIDYVQKTNSKITVISICNYSEYQDNTKSVQQLDNSEITASQQQDNSKPTADQQLANSIHRNNIEIIEKLERLERLESILLKTMSSKLDDENENKIPIAEQTDNLDGSKGETGNPDKPCEHSAEKVLSNNLDETDKGTQNAHNGHGVGQEPKRENETQDKQIDSLDDSGATKSRAKPNPCEEVFKFWQITLSHEKAILDDKRKKFISSALKNFSVDDLKMAIVGCSLTPHNMGQNEAGEIYDKISVIFKDAEQIERFIKNSKNPPVKKVNGTNVANIRNGKTPFEVNRFPTPTDNRAKRTMEGVQEFLGISPENYFSDYVDSEAM